MLPACSHIPVRIARAALDLSASEEIVPHIGFGSSGVFLSSYLPSAHNADGCLAGAVDSQFGIFIPGKTRTRAAWNLKSCQCSETCKGGLS